MLKKRGNLVIALLPFLAGCSLLQPKESSTEATSDTIQRLARTAIYLVHRSGELDEGDLAKIETVADAIDTFLDKPLLEAAKINLLAHLQSDHRLWQIVLDEVHAAVLNHYESRPLGTLMSDHNRACFKALAQGLREGVMRSRAAALAQPVEVPE